MTAFTREASSSCPLGWGAESAGLRAACVGISALVLVLLGAVPAVAELVIFTDGGFLKVDGYQLEGDRMRLELPSGGLLVVAMGRVDRVLDDEVATEPPPPPVPDRFELRFRDGMQMPSQPYGELIFAAAQRHGLNPELIAAVMRAESAYQVEALSHKGARGLMQLMPATAARFGVGMDQIYEPEANIDAGSRYLRFLADRFSDELPLVLAAYNAGEGSVDRYGGVPPYRETRGYLRRIYKTLGLPLELEGQ